MPILWTDHPSECTTLIVLVIYRRSLKRRRQISTKKACEQRKACQILKRKNWRALWAFVRFNLQSIERKEISAPTSKLHATRVRKVDQKIPVLFLKAVCELGENLYVVINDGQESPSGRKITCFFIIRGNEYCTAKASLCSGPSSKAQTYTWAYTRAFATGSRTNLQDSWLLVHDRLHRWETILVWQSRWSCPLLVR